LPFVSPQVSFNAQTLLICDGEHTNQDLTKVAHLIRDLHGGDGDSEKKTVRV
jgi:hypothetical protein